ncbi:MAG: class I tRNA ligase family protein, partial [Candidatus Poribacteria bacterium]
RVSNDIQRRFKFNTAIAATMEMVNHLQALKAPFTDNQRGLLRESLDAVARLLGPFAPHIAEELWTRLGHAESILRSGWPDVDPAALVQDQVTVVVQVNGKLRARVTLATGSTEDDALGAAMNDENVVRHTDGKTVRKVIYVPDRLLNLVVS